MTAATQSLSSKKIAIALVGMLAMPVLLVGGYLLLKQGSKSEVAGSIQLGDATPFAPDRCESGILGKDAPRTRAQFHGVDLFEAARPKHRVRVIEDPERGMVVTIRSDGEAPVLVNREACTEFEVQMEETGAMILDHYGLEGSLSLECPRVVADVSFASCYDGT